MAITYIVATCRYGVGGVGGGDMKWGTITICSHLDQSAASDTAGCSASVVLHAGH